MPLSPILAGEWVDEARIRMPDAPALDKLEIATAVPAPLPPLDGYTFEGFRNADGSVGTKNILGISTSVQCVAGTLEYARQAHPRRAAAEISQCRRRRRVTHAYGCGVAITAPDAVVPIRTLQNIALQSEFRRRGHGRRPRLREAGARAAGAGRRRRQPIVRMQDEAFDGFGAIVDAHHDAWPRRGWRCSTSAQRETCPASDLVDRPAMRRQRRVLRRHRQSRASALPPIFWCAPAPP